MRDVLSADESGVTGAPAFFINGERFTGAFDADSLTARVRHALESPSAAQHGGSPADLARVTT
jgi:hypothetical protein